MRAAQLHAAAPFTKGEKPAFHAPLDNFVKLRLWQLTEYERCVFLDADTVVLKNIDRLFEYPEFSAAPNVYEKPRRFSPAELRACSSARPSRSHIRRDAARGWTARTPSGGVPTRPFCETFFPDWHGLPVYLQHAAICLVQPARAVGLEGDLGAPLPV